MRWYPEGPAISLVLAVMLVGILLLGGCADLPKPPSCTTWECEKAEKRKDLVQQCVRAARDELSEEIMAGIYSGADIRPACERAVKEYFK